jgi:hypothetical protein
MKQQLEIIVPTSWKDLSLNTYLRFQRDAKNFEDNFEAQMDFMIYHFCNLDFDSIRGLSVDSHNSIAQKFNKFEVPDTLPLQRLVKINGVQYGFEPNLSKMAYGVYVDIAQYEELTIDKNWGKIMNILYRPITSKKGDLYTIEPYTGRDDWEKWLDVTMDIHYGALFFFINLHRDLVNATLNSLKEMELQPNIKSTLLKSGRTIQQFLNSQEGIFKGWMR